MGFLNDAVNIGTFGLVPDVTGEDAAAAAAAAGTAANNKSIAETRRQFDLTREDLSPFLEAGTGALGTYQTDINGAPQAPTLGQFSFDPNDALANDPSLAYQMEAGQQQIDRIAGKNGQLSSGNRLYDVTRFGQGLASQSLNDVYNRNLNTYTTNQNTDLKNYSTASDRYNSRLNRLAGLVDVGRGTGTALGQMGGQASSNIAGLLQNNGQLAGSAALAQQQGISGLIGQGIGAIGAAYGAPPAPQQQPNNGGVNYSGFY